MNRILYFLLFLFSAPVYSTVVIISDIDDTIKNSHILDNTYGMSAVFQRPFTGMSDLYQKLYEFAPVYYVSASPGPFINLGRRFLVANGFPISGIKSMSGWKKLEAMMWGGQNEEEGTTIGFKKNAIMRIADEHGLKKGDRLILIGDNGEDDVTVYDIVAQKLSSQGVEVISFIHFVYNPNQRGKHLVKGQRKYLTALDLAHQLYLYCPDLFEEDVLENLLDTMFPQLLSTEYKGIIPYWFVCHDFFKEKIPDINISPLLLERVRDFYKKVEEICRIRTSDT